MIERSTQDRRRSRGSVAGDGDSGKGAFSWDELPGEYAGYEVLDPMDQKIGSAGKLYFNGDGWPEYVRVRIGVLFTRYVLIPVRGAALDRAARSLTLR
jgi:hypothetical protein